MNLAIDIDAEKLKSFCNKALQLKRRLNPMIHQVPCTKLATKTINLYSASALCLAIIPNITQKQNHIFLA